MSKITLDSSTKFFSDFNKISCNIVIDIQNESVRCTVKILDFNFLDEISKLNSLLKKRFHENIQYEFSFNSNDDIKIFEAAINIMKFKFMIANIIFANYKISVIDENICLELDSLAHNKMDSQFIIHLKQIIRSLGSKKNFEFKVSEFAIVMPEIKVKDIRKTTKVLYGSNIDSPSISIEKIPDISFGETFVIEGTVFNFNNIKRPNINIITFNLYYIEDAISCKIFTKESISLDDGTRAKIRVFKEHDKYSGDIVFTVKDIVQIIKKEELKDSYPRVELHAHSKMSELGSLVEIKDLVDKAKGLGHSAVALTDSAVVYGFQDFYNTCIKSNIKPILGVEANVVDDSNILNNSSNFKNSYTVFDIETTGFNPYEDRIIEIGAFKIVEDRIVDKFQSFISIDIPIPKEIKDITNISDDMLKNAPIEEKVLKDFVSFIGDTTLVAHNAEFDMGFLRQKLLKLNIKLENAYLDNLDLARSKLNMNKKHGLKDLANHYNIDLQHHRALADAEATAKIFLKLKKDVDLFTVKRNLKLTYPYRVLLYPKNLDGLKDLYRLISKSHIDGFRRYPRISKTDLLNCKDILKGASFIYGELVDAYSRGQSMDYLINIGKDYDFYEVSPKELLDTRCESEDIIKKLLEIADKNSKMVIATSNVRYIDKSDHKFLKPLSYATNSKYKEGHFFRTTDQMLDSFNFLGDRAKEIVIDNSIDFSNKIDHFSPIPKGFYPPKIDGSEDKVREITYIRAKALYGNNINKVIIDRIELELKAIIENGFSVLYLIAHELVKKSLDDGYIVGSRGSVGSSFVAWLMNITEVNPLSPHYLCSICKKIDIRHESVSGIDLPKRDCCNKEMVRDGHTIPFEVFMGFNGEKVPDIDLNFSGEYQLKIHNYVEELFGKDNVFRAGTISTLAKKNAFGYVSKYFEENNIEISKANKEVYSYKCKNVRKTTGQHPGGLIIIPKDKTVYDFTPIQRPANDQNTDITTTHFDYHVMDEQLVKLDLLGHDDPTNLKILSDLTNIPVEKIPIDDEKTLSIFRTKDALGIIDDEPGTLGIPEFGTPFSRRMLKDTQPQSFADLIRISGLSHGIDVWSNNAESLIKKSNIKLSEVISVRDDIMNYLISQGIDKAISFEIMEFVRKGSPLRKKDKWNNYIDIMKKHNIPNWYIESCSKITYIFPKGHAAAYTLMAVRIAYFKVHYPIEFYMAYLTRKIDYIDFESLHNTNIQDNINILNSKSSLDVKEKNELSILEIVKEMNLRGFDLLPIDIYRSDAKSFIIENNKIRVPLIALKGLGLSVADNIVYERDLREFKSFEDLRSRTKISKTLCEKISNLGLSDLQELNQAKLF
jgi:DNA polymerase-3 subunit alpha (Gram-positive type)